MENLQDLEQPKNLQNSQGEEVSQEFEGDQIEEISGSEFGKFKDARTLANAYNSLQSDYTKKCQALSALLKQVNSEKLPSKEEWENAQKEFFENNAQAKFFSNEISQKISEDKEILKEKNPFDVAWTRYLKENFKAPQSLIKDEKFLNDYVFRNEDIKTKIINDYFNEINFKHSPTLIGDQKGAKSILTPLSRPKTIKEATDLVRDMFD